MFDATETNLPILLSIDDSELIHRLLRARLHNERVQLHTASSSKEGLELARRLKPDVILLDLDMPEMDGFEIITRLKDDPATRHRRRHHALQGRAFGSPRKRGTARRGQTRPKRRRLRRPSRGISTP